MARSRWLDGSAGRAAPRAMELRRAPPRAPGGRAAGLERALEVVGYSAEGVSRHAQPKRAAVAGFAVYRDRPPRAACHESMSSAWPRRETERVFVADRRNVEVHRTWYSARLALMRGLPDLTLE